jgi:transcriptional adapter 2-alpha
MFDIRSFGPNVNAQRGYCLDLRWVLAPLGLAFPPHFPIQTPGESGRSDAGAMSKREADGGAQTPAADAAASSKKQRVLSPRGAAKAADAADAKAQAKAEAAPPQAAASQAPAAAKASMKTCINCQKDLSRTIRITCAECAPQPQLLEFCVECFAVGIELGEHKKHHQYTVSDCLAYPVVRDPTPAASSSSSAEAPATPAKDKAAAGASAGGASSAAEAAAAALADEWTADEELLLLEGIEMFGMGNWKDIADHVATKTEKKCEVHYMNAYLSTNDLIPRFLGDPEDASADSSAKPALANNASLALTDSKGMGIAAPANPQAQADAFSVGPPRERSAPSQLAGYMPLRGDFDVEYDNEAELILADMEFSDDDHPTERELKLKVIEIYNQKLAERERRKKFVVDHGLLDYKLHQQTERRRPKDEREIIAQMRPFARFQTPQEHEKLVEGLIAAMRLRKQILLLQEYRKNGVRTLAETELYDSEKKKREVDQAIQKQRDSASYLYESGRPASSSRDRANRWQVREQGGDNSTDKEHSRIRGGNAAATTSGVNAIAATFNVDGTPGAHLLAPMEKELCSKLKLLPKVGVVVVQSSTGCSLLIRVDTVDLLSAALLGDQGRARARVLPAGLLDQEDGQGGGQDRCVAVDWRCDRRAVASGSHCDGVCLPDADVSKAGQIYEFVVKCGWVKTESGIPKGPSPPPPSSTVDNSLTLVLAAAPRTSPDQGRSRLRLDCCAASRQPGPWCRERRLS